MAETTANMFEAMASQGLLPEFFGQDSDLYACCHLSIDYRNSPAMLICQPTGHEYERCHRAMRQLAMQSVKKGVSTMRFDYHATGDSAGDSSELSFARMLLDAKQAISHLRETVQNEQLTVLGLRLGATLASQLVGSCPEVRSLVLYAPVFDGESLVSDWRRDEQAFLSTLSHSLQETGDDEILGFPIPEKFLAEISRKFLPSAPASSLKRVLFVVDEAEAESPMLDEWSSVFDKRNIEVTVLTVENIAIWKRQPMEAIVPLKTIRHVVKWIRDEHAE